MKIGTTAAILLFSIALLLSRPVCAQMRPEASDGVRPRLAKIETANNYRYESARSDKFTGGRIERTELMPGEPDLKITVDVPAFRLTLWQNGKEVKTYRVGVGRQDYPIKVGDLTAREVIWNPSWVPPDSDWVEGMKTVRAGEVVRAGDSRNPLGKVKIPLGQGYLIHQARSPSDLGNLVSHGCVRMLRVDLYDLAEKIVEARSLPVSPAQINRAKRTVKTLIAPLDPPLPVSVNYDTIIVEGGVLSIYPDVYDRGTSTVADLIRELEENNIDASRISEASLRRMLARPTAKEKFSVKLSSIRAGRSLADGRNLPLVGPLRKK
ncbi:MAG TPA: L,D-transpeptidase [Pyrinomonadaceae bacterium]|nr:L,D-transpeptidase [Pyrinomonadaceae bacterium]